jgi:hypothetical protein
MSIAEGHFRLYTHITPALKAGDYRFTSSQQLTAMAPDGALGRPTCPCGNSRLRHVGTSVSAPRIRCCHLPTE